PKSASGKWYLETGSSMGATLNTAVGKQAYALTDRGTWIAFANKDDFKVLVEGDDKLFNQYGVILVNPAKHPNVKAKEGQAFIDWLTGPEGQAAIADYKIYGEQLFFPNARPQSRWFSRGMKYDRTETSRAYRKGFVTFFFRTLP